LVDNLSSKEDESIYRVIKITVTKMKFERIAEIFWYAFSGEWSKMESIVRNYPDSVRIQLNEFGDTALHVAADAGNASFVVELTKLMSSDDLLIPNTYGMLPVHLAALSGHRIIVQNFFSQLLLDEMVYEDIEKLFFITVVNDMFGKCLTN